MYISAASTISHQNTFQNPGFSTGIRPLNGPSNLIHPDYGAFIPVKESRRMNDILKMAIACSVDCLTQAGVEQPDAIIVGTSMGCNHFTKTFLDKIIEAGEGLISPTAFMLSTHNTIAGQISLFLGNRRHNMTHTQNSLSFEHALTDAILCLREGGKHILVGAADEMENDLYNIHARLGNPDLHITCGSSFFILSAEKINSNDLHLEDVGCYGLTEDLPGCIADFLDANNLQTKDVDTVLFSASQPETPNTLCKLFPHAALSDYQAFSGAYYTNAAFALHYAVDSIRHAANKTPRKILICNNLIPENLGLTLISN